MAASLLSFGEFGHERRDEIALADRIENVRSIYQFAGDAVHGFRRRVAQRDLAEAKPGARQLAVIGGGIASSGLVLSTHLLELAGRLGGTAAPVGGTGTNDRIGGAFIDLREMLQRDGRIVEKAQRDPAGHEVEFRAVIGIGRRRRLAHHSIRGLRVAEVDEPAGQKPPLAPPFIGVLTSQIVGRNREQQRGRGRKFVVSHQPVKAAQREAHIAACFAGSRVEQRPSLGGVRLGGCASFNNRHFIDPETLCSAHRRTEVFGAYAPVHACRVVDAGQLVVELVEQGGLQLGRQFRRPPYRANFARSASLIALSFQHARKREPA